MNLIESHSSLLPSGRYIGNSADHEKLLVVASAISNSVSVYKVQDNPVELRK